MTHSRKKSPATKRHGMTGGNEVSPSLSLHTRTRQVSGVSAAPAAGRSMKQRKELARAGSSSDTIGSPPPPSKSVESREVETEGDERKRKKVVHDASGERWSCRVCGKLFKSQNAVNGHMHVHKNQPNQQAEEVESILLDLGHRKLNPTEGSETKGDDGAVAEVGTSSSAAEARRKKIHMELDLNKEAPEDVENGDEDYGDDDDDEGA